MGSVYAGEFDLIMSIFTMSINLNNVHRHGTLCCDVTFGSDTLVFAGLCDLKPQL